MILPVRYEGQAVASILSEPANFVGRYEDGWIDRPDHFPISLTLPVRPLGFGYEMIVPWLMNLLPEGEPLRAMTQFLGASADDVVALLLETGADLAGALTVGNRLTTGEPGYRPIGDEAALERIINELPGRPFLIDEEGVAMSLAGAQDKLPVALIERELFIPINGAPSTHILKPNNPRLFGSVQNEALCMTLARRMGLPTAPVTTGCAGERSYLLVERYDRTREFERIRRLHQEDFCQALGRYPAAKYQFNKTGRRGPSIPDMFALLREHMTALDTTRLLDSVIFNIAVGNVDSHAKNYSIVLQPQVHFAPLYDLMTGIAWEGITPNHAQEIGGQRRGRDIYARHWERMAKECGLAARATVRRVGQVIGRLLAVLDGAAEEVHQMAAGGGTFLELFVDEVRKRATEVRDHSRLEGDAGADMSTEPSELAGGASAYPS